ncbi:LuxR C-terminal-related transcriptional regulator [Janibacter cremeus]|uniref:DNA-binding CsgD family transcriptional regulator n=1 Tax=Janibacter cremeus TaxID=1285192 RepID=A0A852VKL9_9MICO|nr:LuxR C-terminal-related transcriptional regulator [Janibacter cremeus]NYF97637.1 DNA-binding CsgD family transcriptional regulator [Janibacter cremeus]
MPQPFPLAVWSSSPLHADSLVTVLQQAGERVGVIVEPNGAEGVLVATVETPGLGGVLRRRSRAGRQTIVWGGTLPVGRVAALRDAGASAYVSVLALPRELMDVVHRVRQGEDVPWPESGSEALTAREREAARAYLVTQAGCSRAEVAHGLGISERTLKVHIGRVRDKTGHVGTSTREGLRHELDMRGWL